MSGILYLAATPIGNLEDLTPRVARLLGEADFVAAEDTRVTLKFLNHLGIKKELVSYHRHSDHDRAAYILNRIAAGEVCVLCCDAGTPGISDPGEELVMMAAETGIPVVPLPGACAAIAALVASGLVTGRFCFEGFLPQNRRNRRERLSELISERRTMIFYEAPHKLNATLADLCGAFGPARRVTLARELTKLHEELIRTDLAGAVERFAGELPRGEFVLVVEGAPPAAKPQPQPRQEALLLARRLVADGVKPAAACREAAVRTGTDRKEIYRLLAEEKEEKTQ